MRKALIIGANGPDKLGRLVRLSFAESDAGRFADAITAREYGFSAVMGVRDAAYIIIGQLDQLASDLNAEDEFLLYFAGHGVISHGDLFLVLNGTQQGRLPSTALPWVIIKQIVQRSRARSKVVVLDCCHAGEAIDDPLGGTFRGGIDNEAINTAVRGSTASILVACGPDGFARENPDIGGGVLTSLIVEALGSHRNEASDLTGRVSLESLRNWMWDEIDRRADLASIREERPRLYASGGATFYLDLPSDALLLPGTWAGKRTSPQPIRKSYSLSRLAPDVAQINIPRGLTEKKGRLGTGRLIATNIVLTAAHIFYDQDGQVLADGCEVRLNKDRAQDSWPFRTNNRVVWHDRELDIALINISSCDGRSTSPLLMLRVATVTANNAHLVEVRGYRRDSEPGNRRLPMTTLTGTLTAVEEDVPFELTVAPAERPQDQEWWRGMSGSSVFQKESADPDTIWVYGTLVRLVRDSPGRVSVSRLTDAWQDDKFRGLLTAAGAPNEDAEDPTMA